MYLVELFLPLTTNENFEIEDGTFHEIQSELVDKFGGLTMYSRAPARGLYQTKEGVEHDDVVVIEVMTDTLDTEWWKEHRKRLETKLHQEEILIRAQEVTRL